MATIKSFTDISQSKKLAEILTLESADMNYWCGTQIRIGGHRTMDKDLDVPCWSLTALLGVLPMITKGKDTANPFIAKASDNEYYVVYATLTEEVESSAIYDNPVDACYELIIRLNELNLL